MHPLHQYKILVADADQQLAHVVRKILVKMKFSHIEVTSSGEKAFSLLRKTPYDFLITDWNTQHIDGISLIHRIRRDPTSPNPLLPIIMLSGRAEKTDVVTARDAGINEYVIKPFSAKTIYSRIERIVENPRNFIVSKHFVGPDRRSDGLPPAGIKERRVHIVSPAVPPKDVNSAIRRVDVAKVWLADYSLKNKLGRAVLLESLVTPEVLIAAQEAIDAIANESLKWIKESMAQLQSLSAALPKCDYPKTIVDEISEVTLSINSRAGTFGYTSASEVAYLLYLFCRNQYNHENQTHYTVVQKHIQVLQVIFGHNIKAGSKDIDLIVIELKNLCKKWQ